MSIQTYAVKMLLLQTAVLPNSAHIYKYSQTQVPGGYSADSAFHPFGVDK